MSDQGVQPKITGKREERDPEGLRTSQEGVIRGEPKALSDKEKIKIDAKNKVNNQAHLEAEELEVPGYKYDDYQYRQSIEAYFDGNFLPALQHPQYEAYNFSPMFKILQNSPGKTFTTDKQAVFNMISTATAEETQEVEVSTLLPKIMHAEMTKLMNEMNYRTMDIQVRISYLQELKKYMIDNPSQYLNGISSTIGCPVRTFMSGATTTQLRKVNELITTTIFPDISTQIIMNNPLTEKDNQNIIKYPDRPLHQQVNCCICGLPGTDHNPLTDIEHVISSQLLMIIAINPGLFIAKTTDGEIDDDSVISATANEIADNNWINYVCERFGDPTGGGPRPTPEGLKNIVKSMFLPAHEYCNRTIKSEHSPFSSNNGIISMTDATWGKYENSVIIPSIDLQKTLYSSDLLETHKKAWIENQKAIFQNISYLLSSLMNADLTNSLKLLYNMRSPQGDGTPDPSIDFPRQTYKMILSDITGGKLSTKGEIDDIFKDEELVVLFSNFMSVACINTFSRLAFSSSSRKCVYDWYSYLGLDQAKIKKLPDADATNKIYKAYNIAKKKDDSFEIYSAYQVLSDNTLRNEYNNLSRTLQEIQVKAKTDHEPVDSHGSDSSDSSDSSDGSELVPTPLNDNKAYRAASVATEKQKADQRAYDATEKPKGNFFLAAADIEAEAPFHESEISELTNPTQSQNRGGKRTKRRRGRGKSKKKVTRKKRVKRRKTVKKIKRKRRRTRKR